AVAGRFHAPPRASDIRRAGAPHVEALVAQPRGAPVHRFRFRRFAIRGNAVDGGCGKRGSRRPDRAARSGGRDGQRLSLPSACAAGVEQPAHPGRVSPDRPVVGAAVCGGGLPRSFAGALGSGCRRRAMVEPDFEISMAVPLGRVRAARLRAAAFERSPLAFRRPVGPADGGRDGAAIARLATHGAGGRPGGRAAGAPSLLCQCGAEKHRGFLLRVQGGRVNVRRLLGLDTLATKYSYVSDAEVGWLAAEKAPDRWVATTCGYCSVGCGLFLGVKNGRAVSVRGDPQHPVNRGKLCPKGLSEHHTINAPNRARYPLLRQGSAWLRLTWEQALEAMVGRFREIQARHGPESLAVISTGQLVTEEFYALGKLVQLGFGTKNYDGNTTLCMASAVSGYKRSLGSDGPPGSYEDLEQADVILLIGANIADNHPILCQRLEQNPSRTLLLADPRVTKTAMMADLHLPLRPRSDIALINGIMHIVIRAGLVNQRYIAEHTAGFDKLKASLEKYTPSRVSEITGLSEELICKTALLYGRARAALIGWAMGVNHSTQGTETVTAINNLALITGNIGRAGAAPFSITGQCNAMGTREAGFTSSLPGYRKFESAKDRDELAAIWGVDAERIPKTRGLAYPDIIEAALARKIRALWVIATNPIVSFPNVEVLQQALGSLDFLVVQDGFHPTPTSELADLVLPA